MNDLRGVRSFPAGTALELLHVTGEWRSGFLDRDAERDHPDGPRGSAPANQPVAVYVREPTTGVAGETWLLPADLSPECPRFVFGGPGPLDGRRWSVGLFTRAGAFAEAIGPIQIPREVVQQNYDEEEHRRAHFGTRVLSAATDGDGSVVEVAEITGIHPRRRDDWQGAAIVRVRRSDGWHAFDLLSNQSDSGARWESFGGLLVAGSAVFVLVEHDLWFGGGQARPESGQRIFTLLRVHPSDHLVPVGCFAWRPEVLEGRICGRTWAGETPSCFRWDEAVWALVPDGPVLPLIARW